MHIVKSILISAMLFATPVMAHAKDKKMSGPEVVAIADISVGLNGLVCSFCTLALNKTFKKRSEVAGTYVDLDSKTLSIALSDNQSLDNIAVIKLVKDAGYSVTKISRKDGSEFTPPAKS